MSQPTYPMKLQSVLVKEISTTASPKNRLNVSRVTTLVSPISFGDFSVKLVTAGQEKYRLNGDTFALGAGEYVIGNAATVASVEIDNRVPSEGICAYLSAPLLSEVAEALVPYPADILASLLSANLFISKANIQYTALGAKLTQLSGLVRQVALDDITLNNEFFYETAEAVIQDQIGTEKTLRNLGAKKRDTSTNVLRRLQEAKHYIEENYAQPLSIRHIAQTCGISEYYFTRLFKKAFHYSPYQYIIRTRLIYASTLLAKRVTVTEVALRVGFADLASFSKAFKKHYGQSPQAFRQKSSF